MIRRLKIRRTSFRIFPATCSYHFEREHSFRFHYKFDDILFARRWVHAHRKGGSK